MTIDAFTNLAFDRASVRAEDVDGHMHVSMTPISKATVNPYNGSEIPDCEDLGLDPNKVYNLLRDPKELEKAAASFNGKPLLFTHKPVTSLDHDFEGTVGAVSGVTYEHPYLKAALDIWPGAAIDAIKSGEQKQLSSAYRYKADMTPGEYEGVKYDGVMRDIVGNHVALVKEGRAGPDVMVGDSINGMKDIISMTKPAALSRTAIGAPIALAVLMKPKLAKDTKINWSPLFKGVTAKNFASKKVAMAADIKRQTTGKLAKDATLEDVTELLDALEEVIPGEGPDVEFKQLTDMPKAGEDPVADADDAELRAFLKTLGLSDEDIDKACSMASSPAASEDSAPSDMGTGSAGGEADPNPSGQGGGSAATITPVDRGNYGASNGMGTEDKKAMDELRRELRAASAKIAAMDGKIKQARTDGAADAIRQQREIYEAREFVAPWVGKLPVAMDSAEDVYRTALEARDISDTEGLTTKAMKMILEAQPKAGEHHRAPRALVAQDAAAKAEFDKMFPNANRLKN